MPTRKNALQEAVDFFRRGIATIASIPKRIKDLSVPNLKDLERDYQRVIAQTSRGIKQATPRTVLREAARRGAFGPLPVAAWKLTERYPKTTIPLTYGAAGLLKGTTFGRVTPEKVFGEKLPSPETFGRRATIPHFAGELAGSLPYFEYAFSKAAPLTGLFGETVTKAIPTGKGLVPLATRAGAGFGAKALPSRIAAMGTRGLGAGAILGGFEALTKPGTPKERLAHIPKEAVTFAALEPALALGLPIAALTATKVTPGFSRPLKALAKKFGKNIPKAFISATEKVVNISSQGKGIKAWEKALSKGELSAIKKQYGKIESFWRATTKELRPLGVSVKPTVETLTKIARRKAAPVIKEEKAFLKGLAKIPTALQRATNIARQIQEATAKGIVKNRATEKQIQIIRESRASLRIRNRELIPLMEGLAGESSFARMTRAQAGKVIKFLQPKNWAEIEQAVARVRTTEMGKRLRMVSGQQFTTRFPQLEEQFGAIGVLNNTAQKIANIAENIKGTPVTKEPVGTLRGKIAPLLPEAPAAEATGIRASFHVHLRAIADTARAYEMQIKRALGNALSDLTPKEALQVVSVQAGGPKKGLAPKILERANYLQDVFDSSLAIHNMLRKARGLKPITRRKRYISYIIEENIRRAAKLYDSVAFDKVRKKTFKEFEAGLFEQDPGKIIDIWSRSSADYLKKDLFGSLLRERYHEVQGLGGQAARYARQLMEYDIYNMTSLTDRLLRSGTWLDQKVASIFPKKIPVDKELANAILGTRLNKVLADDIKKGYLKAARFQIPNLATAVHTIFYPAALAWNFGFAILNRTQPLAAIPFIGVKNTLAASVKMHSLLLPWNKAERERYIKILEDGGHFYRRMAAGEVVQTYKGKQPVLRFVDKSINFLANVTELMNRMESAIGAEKFMDMWAEKEGIQLVRAEKEAVMARFAGFVNFMFGAGYAPIAQRSTTGRILYTFQQYPLNQIFDVYTQMWRQSMQDDGAKAFWQTLGTEGGVGPKTMALFEKLPPLGKKNAWQAMLAISIPPAIMYALSGSWNVAQRAFPGMPRVALIDMFTALGEWMDDPELNLEQLKTQIGATFDPRIVQRLADAIDMYTGGIIQTRTRGTPIFTERGDPLAAARLFTFGRQTIPEYEEAYPGLLQRAVGMVTGGGVPGREITKLTREREKIRKETRVRAVQIIKDVRKVRTFEEKQAIVGRHVKELGDQWPDVRDKINEVMEEEKEGVTPLSRRMQVMNVEDRAKAIISEATRISDIEERRKYVRRIQEQGLLTSGVKKEINRIIKDEGFKPKKGIIQNIIDFASDLLSKGIVPEAMAATSQEEIAQSRMAVVFDLLRQKLSPEQIKKILLSEPESDWTEKEINQYLGALGVKTSPKTTGMTRVTTGGGGKKVKVPQTLLTAAGKTPSLVRFPKISTPTAPLDFAQQLGRLKLAEPSPLTRRQIRAPTETYQLRLPRIQPGLGFKGTSL